MRPRVFGIWGTPAIFFIYSLHYQKYDTRWERAYPFSSRLWPVSTRRGGHTLLRLFWTPFGANGKGLKSSQKREGRRTRCACILFYILYTNYRDINRIAIRGEYTLLIISFSCSAPPHLCWHNVWQWGMPLVISFSHNTSRRGGASLLVTPFDTTQNNEEGSTPPVLKLQYNILLWYPFLMKAAAWAPGWAGLWLYRAGGGLEIWQAWALESWAQPWAFRPSRARTSSLSLSLNLNLNWLFNYFRPQ